MKHFPLTFKILSAIFAFVFALTALHYVFSFESSDFNGIVTQRAAWELAPGETDFQDGLSVLIRNHSDNDLSLSNKFWLEYKFDGRWYRVPYKSSSFPEVALTISPHREAVVPYHTQTHYFPLLPGEYRLITEIIDRTVENDYLVLEFRVPFF